MNKPILYIYIYIRGLGNSGIGHRSQSKGFRVYVCVLGLEGEGVGFRIFVYKGICIMLAHIYIYICIKECQSIGLGVFCWLLGLEGQGLGFRIFLRPEFASCWFIGFSVA